MPTLQRDYEERRLRDPLPEAASALRDTPTAVLSDALVAMGVHPHVIHGLRPLVPSGQGSRLFGRAVTLGYAPVTGSHSFSEAPYLASTLFKIADPGDVVVLAADGAQYSLFGDHMASMGAESGVGGALIDGCVRDVEGIREIGVPAFCAGSTPEAFLGHIEGVSLNEPVTVRGVTIAAGDLIVGDQDGVVVVPRAGLETAVRVIEEMQALADWTDQVIADGMSPEEMYAESDRRRTEIRELARGG
jgi:regulator of RNase E activity RraA